jgi:RNA polymerase sigma-70 factor (ECF subfamily)
VGAPFAGISRESLRAPRNRREQSFVAEQGSQPPDANPGQRVTPVSLLERIKKHDQRAWQRFAQLYSPLLYHWCQRWQVRGADADDVVQEVYQAVLAGIATYRREQEGRTYPFRAWLAGIIRNKLRDYYRRLSALPTAEGGSDAYRRFQEIPEPPLPDEEADAEAVSAVYHQALELVRGEFEERTWQAFWRTTVDGQPAPAVAAELGMSAAAVRKAKSRVLHRLKAEVGDIME